MMAAAVEKFNDIDEIKFTVTLSNLDNFKRIRTKTFYVRGNPWAIKFVKVGPSESNPFQSSLGVFLYSETEFENENVSIVAKLKTKIISTKFNQKSHTFSTDSYAFYSQSSNWGDDNLISWAELIDPEKGYVQNGTCKIIVKVKASPLLNDINNGSLHFDTLKQCLVGAFEIKINRIYDFFNVCTPIIVLNEFQWRILVSKYKNETNQGGVVKGEDLLRIELFNLSLEDECDAYNISCKAKISGKLVSYDPEIEPVREHSECKELKYSTSSIMMDMISWNELLNPQKKFVENGSLILQVEIEVSEAKGQKVAKNDALRLACPICFHPLVNQPISVTKCGHLFCGECITEALQRNKNCPSCGVETMPKKLRRIYLPLQ